MVVSSASGVELYFICAGVAGCEVAAGLGFGHERLRRASLHEQEKRRHGEAERERNADYEQERDHEQGLSLT